MALIREPSRGSEVTIDRVRSAGGPRAALDAVCGLLADSAQATAHRDITTWAEEGIDAVACSDARFPPGLKELPAAPAILFMRGRPAPEDTAGVAVIGTRHPSRDGIDLARALALALVDDGRTVVSGLAAGIDTAAHRSALHAGGRTLAVLGNGLHHVYPAENGELQKRIPLLVSQFLPDQAPTRQSFPRRNAVMSAISIATVIVEAGERSGARIQARQAIGQGRPLFLMRALLSQPWARELAAGTGVHVVDGPGDLITGLTTWTG